MYFSKSIYPLRFILFPFAFLYGTIIYIRNFLFDKGILLSRRFSIPIICIGNLSVGGTGKTPMTEMLLSVLHHQYKTATLSRGYKRKTKGFLIAGDSATVAEIGDEPMQFHNNFPDVLVAVDEDRSRAIQALEQLPEAPQVILLDDAMQHRRVKADINILLTDYSNLYVNDYFLPVGNLRDQRYSSKRADIIIITKCPSNMALEEKALFFKKIKPSSRQQLFFSTIDYGTPYNIFTKTPYSFSQTDEIIAIAGIAKPQPYFDYLQNKANLSQKIIFPDHHDFTEDEIKKIFSTDKNNTLQSNRIYMLTEKDAVKIKSYQHLFINLSTHIYILPIKCVILYDELGVFFNKITAVIDKIKN